MRPRIFGHKATMANWFLAAIILVSSSSMIVVYYFEDGIYYFVSSINTMYAKDFSYAGFSNISQGSNLNEVLGNIGYPSYTYIYKEEVALRSNRGHKILLKTTANSFRIKVYQVSDLSKKELSINDFLSLVTNIDASWSSEPPQVVLHLGYSEQREGTLSFAKNEVALIIPEFKVEETFSAWHSEWY